MNARIVTALVVLSMIGAAGACTVEDAAPVESEPAPSLEWVPPHEREDPAKPFAGSDYSGGRGEAVEAAMRESTANSTVATRASGRGTETTRIHLAAGQYVCTSEVRSNRADYGGGDNFIVVLHGDFGWFDRELLANEIAASGRWDSVVNAGGGSYLVEVDASGSWTVTCR